MVALTLTDLALAALLVVLLALTSMRIQTGISRQLLIAAVRTAIQLSLIGLVLKTLFENAGASPVAGVLLSVRYRCFFRHLLSQFLH